MLSAIVFWRESPIGVVSLAMMCGGDGNTISFCTFVYVKKSYSNLIFDRDKLNLINDFFLSDFTYITTEVGISFRHFYLIHDVISNL